MLLYQKQKISIQQETKLQFSFLYCGNTNLICFYILTRIVPCLVVWKHKLNLFLLTRIVPCLVVSNAQEIYKFLATRNYKNVAGNKRFLSDSVYGNSNFFVVAGIVQPKITTCILGLATVVITLGNLASFPSYSCLVYMIL